MDPLTTKGQRRSKLLVLPETTSATGLGSEDLNPATYFLATCPTAHQVASHSPIPEYWNIYLAMPLAGLKGALHEHIS